MAFLSEEGRKLLAKFGLTEQDLEKPQMLGKPWKDHSIVAKGETDGEFFTCAFCIKEAVNKVWLGGYTGVLVCQEHELLLSLQTLSWFTEKVKK